MGVLLPVARVGCLSGPAMARLEEWSPIVLRHVDRTRLTGPLAVSSFRDALFTIVGFVMGSLRP